MDGIVLQGLIAGLGTCLGALLVITLGRMRPGTLSLMLGLASGIMTAVIIFDLLPSSLRYGSPIAALAGFMGGITLMLALDLGINIFAPAALQGRDYLKMGYLIATGIALHDLPEGLAIAAGFATAEKLGPLLVLAIGLHNIPEGMATAAPLRHGGLSAGRVLAINILISLITPVGTFFGLALLESSRSFIGPLLAFAAGAMTYIVLGELAPESRRNSRPLAYLGMLFGLSLILMLSFIVSG
ncbi:ZIP family metal transporter [Pelotomaculum terephthalicicum JT]|uniref:ZIP family metal transporter n=1 Tax=Pelotomaculum TaxID=191373 RepID=UPI0009C5C41C|nr:MULTISPECIES: ZIP family metal transporter [Pelotomaculum]MCG9969025.1 ZIP family metal transporter [Pelotomaculum terephthalicicum JT]OPX91371.1 MAG: Zinc transporter ZupT [Pelotomaculum sp. PtaB.Bin117]OPY60594.1 MAG: Zinc transporter ZupT [Pelotomaculum sp. PtaU1.Bin065]